MIRDAEGGLLAAQLDRMMEDQSGSASSGLEPW
jgi:hypothetical protein